MVSLAAKCLEQLEGNVHSNVPAHPPLEGKQVRGQVMSAQGSGVAAPGSDRFSKQVPWQCIR